MPRTSKLAPERLKELEVRLNIPESYTSVQALALEFHLAPASVFYYKKKFVITVATLYSQRIQRPKKDGQHNYEWYLRQYYERVGRPYETPPLLEAPDFGRHLNWL